MFGTLPTAGRIARMMSNFFTAFTELGDRIRRLRKSSYRPTAPSFILHPLLVAPIAKIYLSITSNDPSLVCAAQFEFTNTYI